MTDPTVAELLTLLARGTEPPADELSKVAAGQAAALGVLLAGLSGDPQAVTREIDRIFDVAGTKVARAVLAFMTAHASEAFVYRYTTRDAAIVAVEGRLAAAERVVEQGTQR